MRRLVVLVGVIVLVDTILYSALAPILPALSDEFSLSKSESGVLVGAYAAGTLVGALPAGWLIARVGARAVLVGGLLTMTATGLWFALASTHWSLDAARFAQGLGGAATWTAGLAWLAQESPREKRGQVLGTVIGAGIFGAQFGPVVGGIAESVGRGPTFAVLALSGLGLAAWALVTPAAAPAAPSTGTLRGALADRGFRAALWVTLLPAICSGMVVVLLPLRLDELGASTVAIAGVFLVAAILEAAVSPLTGRWVDRHGMRGPILVGLVAGAVGLVLITLPQQWVVLGGVAVLLVGALGMLWTPGGNLASLTADRLGLDQGWAFAVNNMQWAGGIAVGSAAGGALGDAVGDWLPLLIGAGMCLLTAGIWWSGRGIDPDRPLPSRR